MLLWTVRKVALALLCRAPRQDAWKHGCATVNVHCRTVMCSPEDKLGDEVHDSEALGGGPISASEHDGTKSHDAGRRNTAPLAPNPVANDTCNRDIGQQVLRDSPLGTTV